MSTPDARDHRITRRNLLRLGALLGGGALFGRAPLSVFSAAQTRDVLSNGLVVLTEERRGADTVAVQLLARAGSRDDAGLFGITVATSRMMFQGTGRRPSESELQRTAALVGGTLERGTTTESSFFTGVVPAREAELAFDLVADVVADPLFADDAFARYQGATLQELAARRANPALVIEDLFTATMFEGHPASTPIVGTPESVGAFSVDDLWATRGRLWGASNLALAVVGRIRPQDALELAISYFSDLQGGAGNLRQPVTATPAAAPRTVRATAGQAQAQLRLGFPAPGQGSAEEYALRVLNEIATNRIFREVRGEQGLAYSAGSAYRAYTDTGVWFAAAGVDPQNVQSAVAVIEAEISRMRSEGLSEAEVAQVITQVAGRQVIADETNAARAGRLASQEVLGTPSAETALELIRQVTPADVQRAAQRYLDPQRAVTFVVGPAGS